MTQLLFYLEIGILKFVQFLSLEALAFFPLGPFPQSLNPSRGPSGHHSIFHEQTIFFIYTGIHIHKIMTLLLLGLEKIFKVCPFLPLGAPPLPYEKPLVPTP